jgi:hypothetical protein
MLISELTFPHLLAERDARLTRELEQRRVIEERRADAAPTGRAFRQGRGEPRRDAGDVRVAMVCESVV